jgi:hypothetical protein
VVSSSTDYFASRKLRYELQETSIDVWMQTILQPFLMEISSICVNRATCRLRFTVGNGGRCGTRQVTATDRKRIGTALLALKLGKARILVNIYTSGNSSELLRKLAVRGYVPGKYPLAFNVGAVPNATQRRLFHTSQSLGRRAEGVSRWSRCYEDDGGE